MEPLRPGPGLLAIARPEKSGIAPIKAETLPSVLPISDGYTKTRRKPPFPGLISLIRSQFLIKRHCVIRRTVELPTPRSVAMRLTALAFRTGWHGPYLAGAARIGLRRRIQWPGSARHGVSAAALAWPAAWACQDGCK